MKSKRPIKILITATISLSLLSFATGCSPATTSDRSTQTQQTKATNIQYYFSQANQHPDQELIKVINSSSKSLDIAIYSLTKKEIVNAILEAKKRGVTVRVITDKQESGNKSQSTELTLIKNAKIPIKINTHKGLMHLKVTIADRNITTTGSYNYTQAATNDNDEVLMIISDSKVSQDFEDQFERMWNDSKNFKDYKS